MDIIGWITSSDGIASGALVVSVLSLYTSAVQRKHDKKLMATEKKTKLCVRLLVAAERGRQYIKELENQHKAAQLIGNSDLPPKNWTS